MEKDNTVNRGSMDKQYSRLLALKQMGVVEAVVASSSDE